MIALFITLVKLSVVAASAKAQVLIEVMPDTSVKKSHGICVISYRFEKVKAGSYVSVRRGSQSLK